MKEKQTTQPSEEVVELKPEEAVEVLQETPTPKETPQQQQFRPAQIDTIRKKALDEARQHILSAYNELVRADGERPVDKKDDRLRELENKARDIGASDLLVSYDIRLLNQDGELIHLHDDVKLSLFTDQDMLMESRRNFEQVLYSTILRPIINKVQSYLNRFIENTNTLPDNPTISDRNVRPRILPSGPSAFAPGADGM